MTDYVTLIGGPYHGRVVLNDAPVLNMPTARTLTEVARYAYREFGAINGSVRLSGHAMVWSELGEEDGWKLALRTFADSLCGDIAEATP